MRCLATARLAKNTLDKIDNHVTYLAFKPRAGRGDAGFPGDFIAKAAQSNEPFPGEGEAVFFAHYWCSPDLFSFNYWRCEIHRLPNALIYFWLCRKLKPNQTKPKEPSF